MCDSKGDGRFQSLWCIFNAHAILLLRHEDLPENFDDIPDLNVYDAPGAKGGDWKQYLKDKGEAWIITPLHNSSGTGSKYIRKASGGGRWDDRTGPLLRKKNVDASWVKRKYILKTKEGTGLPTYTMFEYSPVVDNPTHALCRITVDNKNISSSQQREGKENYHTDSNNGEQGETSLSHESMQQDNKNNAHDRPLSSSQQRKGKEFDHGNKGHKGGNYQKTTADNNQQNLERKLRELIKHHSFADIRKVLAQIESEKLPAASPKEHSTEAPVSNTRKRGRCSYTNTMEAGTSTQGQKQVKVEMLESNSCRGDTTNLHDGTDRNCIELGEQSSHHCNCNEKNAEQGSNPINLADIPEPYTFEQLCNSDDDEMVEPNADVQEPNNLSHNFNANSTEPTESNSYPGDTTNLHDDTYRNCIDFGEQSSHHCNCNEKNAEQGSNPINLADFPESFTFEELCNSDDQEMVEPNADVQEPNNLSHNFNANSTEPTDNWNYHPIYNQPSTSYSASIDDLLDLQDPDNLSVNLNANSTEGMELSSYNQNTIAPGPSTSNHATTVPENIGSNDIYENLSPINNIGYLNTDDIY